MSGTIHELTMPKWGLTMEEGTLSKWLIEEGDQIEKGMAIAEVETDKIVNTLEATQVGVLAKKVADEDEVLPVGALIGVITEGDVSADAVEEFVKNYKPLDEQSGADEEAAAPAEAAPAAAASGKEEPYRLTMPKWGLTMEEGTLAKWLKEEGDQINLGDAIAEVETDKIVNTMEATHPGILKRRIAEEGDELPVGALLGIIADASTTDQEIDAFLAGESAPAGEPAAEEAPSECSKAQDQVIPLKGMRAAITKTVTTSWTTIPHYMVTVAIDMGEAEALSKAQKEAGNKVSINDMLIKALAVAIPKYPNINASFTDKGIAMHSDVNIAVAVGLDDGLVMPVIKGCQNLSVQQIGAKSRELVGMAKDNKLGKEELSGATFAISNMGMLGVESFIAIVPPNLSAILAVGTVKDEPVVRDGKVVIARMMRVTISADHRVHDGSYGAKFLGELKSALEAPAAFVS